MRGITETVGGGLPPPPPARRRTRGAHQRSPGVDSRACEVRGGEGGKERSLQTRQRLFGRVTLGRYNMKEP